MNTIYNKAMSGLFYKDGTMKPKAYKYLKINVVTKWALHEMQKTLIKIRIK